MKRKKESRLMLVALSFILIALLIALGMMVGRRVGSNKQSLKNSSNYCVYEQVM